MAELLMLRQECHRLGILATLFCKQWSGSRNRKLGGEESLLCNTVKGSDTVVIHAKGNGSAYKSIFSTIAPPLPTCKDARYQAFVPQLTRIATHTATQSTKGHTILKTAQHWVDFSYAM
jgi:hypothetical protein